MMCLEELLLYARNTFKFASRETGENVSDCFLVEFSPRSGKSEDLYFSKKKGRIHFLLLFFLCLLSLRATTCISAGVHHSTHFIR